MDLQEIKNTVKLAFYREGKDEVFNEWEFVEKVMHDKGFEEDLCLVAELNGELL